jgi:hypothetical protein
MPEPASRSLGLGMNVAWPPSSRATSLTQMRKVATASAIVSASV